MDPNACDSCYGFSSDIHEQLSDVPAHTTLPVPQSSHGFKIIYEWTRLTMACVDQNALTAHPRDQSSG